MVTCIRLIQRQYLNYLRSSPGATRWTAASNDHRSIRRALKAHPNFLHLKARVRVRVRLRVVAEKKNLWPFCLIPDLSLAGACTQINCHLGTMGFCPGMITADRGQVIALRQPFGQNARPGDEST